MQILKSVSLANYSSFHTGGIAESLVICDSAAELLKVISEQENKKLSCLGFGTNVLISDKGLDGTVAVCRGGSMKLDGTMLIAGAGVWWDDLVERAIDEDLWGVELMSGIPSSIGGAIMGNIAAYGQQISDTLEWVEVIATDSQKIERIPASTLSYDYRYCSLKDTPGIVVLRAGFKLSKSPTQTLEYGSALRIATELQLSTDTLPDRRAIILEARSRAGSLYDPSTQINSYTAGSFFKNPIVSLEQAKKVIAFDETGKSTEVLLRQNQIHGGSDHRVSAAHVMLAADFSRGQSWGSVRLHPDHILKIENTGNATSQEIYDVAQLIIHKAKEDLDIDLEPEVQFLGDFNG